MAYHSNKDEDAKAARKFDRKYTTLMEESTTRWRKAQDLKKEAMKNFADAAKMSPGSLGRRQYYSRANRRRVTGQVALGRAVATIGVTIAGLERLQKEAATRKLLGHKGEHKNRRGVQIRRIQANIKKLGDTSKALEEASETALGKDAVKKTEGVLAPMYPHGGPWHNTSGTRRPHRHGRRRSRRRSPTTAAEAAMAASMPAYDSSPESAPEGAEVAFELATVRRGVNQRSPDAQRKGSPTLFAEMEITEDVFGPGRGHAVAEHAAPPTPPKKGKLKKMWNLFKDVTTRPFGHGSRKTHKRRRRKHRRHQTKHKRTHHKRRKRRKRHKRCKPTRRRRCRKCRKTRRR